MNGRSEPSPLAIAQVSAGSLLSADTSVSNTCMQEWVPPSDCHGLTESVKLTCGYNGAKVLVETRIAVQT
jgi:hypothetical protein